MGKLSLRFELRKKGKAEHNLNMYRRANKLISFFNFNGEISRDWFCERNEASCCNLCRRKIK